MSGFDEFWTQHVALNGRANVSVHDRVIAQIAWNEALTQAQILLGKCCCGHETSQHEDETGKCEVAGCACFNCCSCWHWIMDDDSTRAQRISDAFMPLF